MSAGRKVMMEFSSGESLPVNTKDIAAVQKAAKDAGGWARVANRTGMMGQIMPRQYAASWLDKAGMAGGVAGSSVGGVIGSALGPGGAVAGRVIGGSAGGYLGQQVSELGYRAMGLGDAPGTPEGEALTQGAFGAAGEALGAVGQGAGRALIRTGLPAKLAESGRVVGEMVKERLPIGGIEQLNKIPVVGRAIGRGADFAKEHWLKRVAERNAVNAAAGAAGARIPRKAAEDAIKNLIKETSSEMGDDSEVKYLKMKLKSWRARKLDMLPPSEVQPIITRFDAKSKPVFAAIARGENVPTAGMQARAAYQRDVANALRDAMRQNVPGHEAASAALGTASATKTAIQKAEHGGIKSLGSRFATGAALTAAGEKLAGNEPNHRMGMDSIVGGALLASPALLSRGGLLLTDPYVQSILRQTPRFVLDRTEQ